MMLQSLECVWYISTMTTSRSTLGFAFSGLYLLLCAFLIGTQGLFGESFIAIILGLPLSLLMASVEFGNVEGPFLYVLVLLPIIFNAFLLYWIGYFLGKYSVKIPLIFMAAIIAFIGGFFAFNHYIYTEKQGDGEVTSYRGTLSGEVVCLPHKDTDGPHTLECAIGMKTDTGEYYAVDMAMMSQQHAPLETGERFKANGLITPVEMLSSDHWQIYDIEGIFSITDSVEML